MARQFSPRNFLRHAPNELLARYFHERELLLDLDIAAVPETKVDAVFEAMEKLPAERRAEIDSDFLLVHLLADEQGIQAILDEGEFQQVDLGSAFEKLKGFYDKVLLTLLDYPKVAAVAGRFRESEHLPGNYWYRRWENVPQVTPRDDGEAAKDLARNVAAYFHLKEGRGRECEVDVYRRGPSFYFFALPEDYGQAALEYDKGKLARRARRPVFEVVFVYDPSRPALETFFRGQKKTRLELEKIFTRVILKAEIETERDDKVYNLNLFKQRGVKFTRNPASGIEDVRVKFLRLSLLGGGRQYLTLEADPTHRREAIYDLMDSLFGQGGNGTAGHLSLALANIKRVGLQVLFTRAGRGRPTKTFYLGQNACTLTHHGRDLVLRQMLVDSKIEPAKPPGAVAKG